MPYTPPSQRSPANSNASSPVLSRGQSYFDHVGSSPSTPQRPNLPRSLSSAAYLQKHRRTPSISDNKDQDDSRSVTDASGPPANGSLRQSPSPVNNSLIPSGAITTPPDSAHNSDDEGRGRCRDWGNVGNVAALKEALQSIEVKRGGSPNRAEDDHTPAAPKSTPTRQSGRESPALSPEARKISHSRSTSELTLSTHNTGLTQSPVSSPDDSDVEDDGLRIKPPLLRKKSGELVKPALRPSSRRRPSSMPGTPTFSKAVHFNEDIEQVRHFLQVDRPIAVSAGSSPVEMYEEESEYPFGDEQNGSRTPEWDIRLANFPSNINDRTDWPVRVERLCLSADHQSLVGAVAVANVAFQKLVVARFTLDYWKTTSEVVAEYNSDVRKKQVNDGYDRFNFSIKLSDQAHLESKTLLLCFRYSVNGQDFWDNNCNLNYQVDFVKKSKAKTASASAKSGTQGLSVGAIPRSRHSPPTSRGRTVPSSAFDDDFNNFDSKYQFGSGKPIFGEPSKPLRFKNKERKGGIFPDQARGRPNQPGQAFSTRYDFGASLSAALTQAQTQLGDRSGIKVKNAPKTEAKDFAKKDSTASNAPPPPAVLASSDKPDLKSAEYNELIQKYCFVRTSGARVS